MYQIDFENEELIIDTKKFKLEGIDHKLQWMSPKRHELANVFFTIEDYPDSLMIDVKSEDGFGTSLFTELSIRGQYGQPIFKFGTATENKYWKDRWGMSTFLATFHDIAVDQNDLVVSHCEIETDWRGLILDFPLTEDFEFESHLQKCIQRIKQLITQTEITLSGVLWRHEFLTNESAFCTDLLYPLLRKMNFVDVRYTHGTKEYGKDFTFSEQTRFGNLRHYCLQAKSGNIRGNVNSDIDEIIGQFEDAFKMPYYEVSANESRNISTFILAISGSFTDNAKAKIIHKIPPYFKGCIYFLDKDKLQELIERFWN